jgi:hypothetical protein
VAVSRPIDLLTVGISVHEPGQELTTKWRAVRSEEHEHATSFVSARGVWTRLTSCQVSALDRSPWPLGYVSIRSIFREWF